MLACSVVYMLLDVSPQAITELDGHKADMSPEQLARFDREAAVILERYPGADDLLEREAALLALARYLTDELEINDVGETLDEARMAVDEAMVVAQTVARLAVLDGMSEVAAAGAASIDRMTVRKALGKR